jgi:ribosomal protein S18 acetylase RimI-like enzyme
MIEALNHRRPVVAEQIYGIQQASYAVERDLLDYPDFPPLRVRPEDIQQETEQFLGYWNDGTLAGVVSFSVDADRLDIGRMIVHPHCFRRGIASALLAAVEGYAKRGQVLSVSTAEKNVPALQLYEKHGYRRVQRTVLADGLVLVRLDKSTAKHGRY